MKSKFSDYLEPLNEAEPSLEDQKAEFIEFIQELDKETFAELMDVISSIMMDPTSLGSEDDHEEEIEGDKEIVQAIEDGSTPEELSKELTEAFSDEINERGDVPAGDRLAAAKLKKRDPRIKRMNKIKNAWRKKCKKRGLVNQKTDSGKWGCGKVSKLLSIKAKRSQHNRQHSVKA